MTRYLLTGMIFALGCTTASAQSPTDPQADTQRLGGAPTLAAGPPPPDDAAGEVTVWTDGSAQTGYSAFTCDGSGNVATNTLTATQSTWTVNATPAGVYSASTIGIGVTDPGAYFDLRYAWGGGKDAIDVAMAGPNTSNGIEIDFARGYGSDFTHPTSTDWTTVLYDLDAWGYTTGDTPALASHVRSTVDEHNTATTIPGDVEIWNTTATGANVESFRVDSAQHVSSIASNAPTLTSCGTGAAFVAGEATDVAGTIAVGAGALGCTLTFVIPWTQVFNGQLPHCTITSRSGVSFSYDVSGYGITLASALGALGGANVDYTCIGGQRS